MEKFDAKGQIVFVEPKWVTGETCLFNITNRIQYLQAQSKVTKMRKQFLSRLEQEGFVITYDKNINDDIVCLIMNDESICDNDTDFSVYKKAFDELIFKAGGEKFMYPNTLTVLEYFEKPFFPAVFKNELMNAGIDKFLIENQQQLEIIKQFYKDFSNDKKVMDAFENSIFQQLIETPTKYKTYMRVLMSASGDVMGASLKYSNVESQKRSLNGTFEPYFFDEKSKYFLNCSGMFNYYSGGGNISFSQPKYSDEKKEILKAHGIDVNNVMVPQDVLEVASLISQKCNKELGIMCGIDFIFNEQDGKWYYLENQAFPAIEEWADQKGIRIKHSNTNTVEDYVKYLEIELEARHDALIMYMNKKFAIGKTEEGIQYVLKLK